MPLYRVQVTRIVGLLVKLDIEAPDPQAAKKVALEEEDKLEFGEYMIAHLEDAAALVEEPADERGDRRVT